MFEEQQLKTKIEYPLTNSLIKYILQEEPKIGQIIISAIEFTLKDSNDHYNDIFKSLEPLLKEKTRSFLSKIFIYKKRQCRYGNNCTLERCVFLHEKDVNLVEIPVSEINNTIKKQKINNKEINDDDNNLIKKYISEIDIPNKKQKTFNKEVVFNKVNEINFNLEDIREYATKYGKVISLRRLNRGKYLIIFEDSESAQNLIECSDIVLNDTTIKKFYNVNIKLEEYNKENYILELLKEQRYVLNELSDSYDKSLINNLKEITDKIRNYILNKNGNYLKNTKIFKKSKIINNIESSLYYNMFTN